MNMSLHAVRTILSIFVHLLICTVPLVSSDGGGPFIRGKMLGSEQLEQITGMVKLSTGNVAVCGWTDSFDAWLPGGYQEQFGGTEDGFVAILTPDLSTVLNFTFFGGPQSDKITDIAVEANGSIVIIGHTESTNLPTTIGSNAPIYSANIDGFLFSLSSDLTKINYGTYIPGQKNEFPKVVFIDAPGNIYICGTTNSEYGFPTNNGYDKTHNGSLDGFVMKYSSGASIIQFSTYFGGPDNDEFLGMTVTPSGGIFLTGYTSGGGYQIYPTLNPMQWWLTKDRPYDWTYNGGVSDAVLTVFSEDGARLIVSSYYGGADADTGRAIVFDDKGRINLFGDTRSADLPFESGFQGSNKGGSDVFMAQFNETGRTLLASTYLGGDGNDFVNGAERFTTDQFVIYGTSSSRNFPVIGGGSSNELMGASDAFIVSSGVTSIDLSTLVGGDGIESFASCFVDSRGTLTFAGVSSSTSIEIGNGSIYNHGARGTLDGCVLSYARGVLNLATPVGAETFCIDQQNTVSWSVIDMPSGELYKLQVRSSGTAEWITIADSLSGKSYQWKPGSSLEPTATYTLRVLSTRDHDSRTERYFSLLPKVVIVQSPPDAWVCQGDTARITINVLGEELQYSWKKDGVPLSGFKGPKIEIPNFQQSNSGRYECTVQSSCGQSANSQFANIGLGKTTSITKHPVNIAAVVGNPVTLSVSSEGSDLRYQWYKDGALLDSKTNAALTITSVALSDAGQYHCIVIGSCGTMVSEKAVLSVTVTSVEDGEPISSSVALVSPLPVENLATVYYQPGFFGASLTSINGVSVVVFSSNTIVSEATLDCSDLAPGAYMLTLKKASGDVVRQTILIR